MLSGGPTTSISARTSLMLPTLMTCSLHGILLIPWLGHTSSEDSPKACTVIVLVHHVVLLYPLGLFC